MRVDVAGVDVDLAARFRRGGDFLGSLTGGRPLLVEVGFGRGDFLVYLARRRPEAVVLGIENSISCVDRARRRVLREGLPNVRLLLGDARLVVKELLPPGSVSAFFVNFPCPWPKRRHEGRRLFSEGSAGFFLSALCPGGILRLLTDEEWYAEEVALAFEGEGGVEISLSTYAGGEVVTKYEQRWRSMGKPIFELLVRKRESTPSPVALEEEVRLLQFDLRVRFDSLDESSLASLEGVKLEGEGWSAFVKDLYRGKRSYIWRVFLREEGLLQIFFVELVPRGDGCMLKLDSATQPYRTRAVSALMREMADLIVDLGDKRRSDAKK